MLKVAVFLVAIACALGAVLVEGHVDGRIVGGSNATIESFPYQVSFQRDGAHFCGASIYNETIIVTAAHCLYAAETASLTIRAGSSEWNSGGVVVAVAAYKIHDHYDSSTISNDVAILRLAEPLKFSATIRPIALASELPAEGAAAVVTGWGVTAFGSTTIPTILRYINIYIIRANQCASSSYGYGSKIEPNMICAAAKGKSICNEDSGGPLVSGGVLVGIVSWGEGCGQAKHPGVFASVAVAKTWILQAAKNI